MNTIMQDAPTSLLRVLALIGPHEGAAVRRVSAEDEACQVVIVNSLSQAGRLLDSTAVDALLVSSELGRPQLEALADLAASRDLPLLLLGDFSVELVNSLRKQDRLPVSLGREPISAEEIRNAMRRATCAAPDSGKVWVVDDSAAMQALMRSLLRREGLEVIVSGDMQEAVDLLDAGVSPSLIVLDVNLPDGNGIDLLRKIRAQGDVPVVVISNLREAELVQEAFALGASEFIEKPFSPRELVARIQRHL